MAARDVDRVDFEFGDAGAFVTADGKAGWTPLPATEPGEIPDRVYRMMRCETWSGEETERTKQENEEAAALRREFALAARRAYQLSGFVRRAHVASPLRACVRSRPTHRTPRHSRPQRRTRLARAPGRQADDPEPSDLADAPPPGGGA